MKGIFAVVMVQQAALEAGQEIWSTLGRRSFSKDSVQKPLVEPFAWRLEDVVNPVVSVRLSSAGMKGGCLPLTHSPLIT